MDRIAENTRALARIAARLAGARLRGAARHGSSAPFCLALFTDERAGDPLALTEALPRLPAARLAVIFRHYRAEDRRALAIRTVRAAHRRGALALVAGDAALALGAGADGVHLPERDIGRLAALRAAHPRLILSAACHSLAALRAAEKGGADCACLSPVFQTASHPGAPCLGRRHLARLAAASPLPVLALGGITRETAHRLIGTGASGLGAIDGFTS